ncbi:hypothetical protein FNL56_09340 [Tardiphaga sp. vice304]|uniref:hypothetical protein n=1 Tax=unclassified Tardiphaga TaxID=2631404 RepID=UPI0011631330|nr:MULTISPECIES: hypothetical protein [unclassified Tardiphaga]QDM16061.1 hypothetical protein FNL53_09190 [Tardiphaga sp. vice278]QDM26268.1 hypothetical protein FNL56_09340 [Tardiphaga sp. vice304]
MKTDPLELSVVQEVDYEYWSKMPGWTVAEAAALFLDIDPDKLPEKSDKPETPGWRYWRLRRLLARARNMDELESPMVPRDFIAWAVSNGLKPSEQLVLPVRAGKPHRNWRTRYSDMRKERDVLRAELDDLKALVAEPTGKAKFTLLTIIGGLARSKFDHFRNSPQTVSKLQRSLSDVGISVDNGTIRSCLKAVDRLFEDKYPDLK